MQEDLETYLQQALCQKSSLTRSYWYGKFLQGWSTGSRTTRTGSQQEQATPTSSHTHIHTHTQQCRSHSPSRTPPHAEEDSIARGGRRRRRRKDLLGTHSTHIAHVIREAEESLRQLETSLSPHVHKLLTQSIPDTRLQQKQQAKQVVVGTHDGRGRACVRVANDNNSSSSSSSSNTGDHPPSQTPLLHEEGYSLDWEKVEHLLGFGKDCAAADTSDFGSGACEMGVLAGAVWQEAAAMHGCTDPLMAAAPGRSNNNNNMDASTVTDRHQLVAFRKNVAWTHSPKVFVECLQMLFEGTSELKCVTSLLLSSAALERALGDVYLSVSGDLLRPSMLKDLLSKEELSTLFGQTAVYCLKCLIGPPSGLNLRNVLWHGFATSKEVPIEYAFLLLVMASSLGQVYFGDGTQTRFSSATPLAPEEATPLPLTLAPPPTPPQAVVPVPSHQPYVTFPQETLDLLASVFKCGDFGDPELDSILDLFSSSFFILPSMLPTWTAAIQALRERRYAHFLVLLLPGLEHGLRRVFACVNGCPEKILTAESTTLYTTFDEILSSHLPCGSHNHLLTEIGRTKMEMLLDLLVHPEGPRLRDRISHGEVDFHSVPLPVCSQALCIAVVFCAQCSLQEEKLKVPSVVKCLEIEERYTSLFHPLSLLRRELCKLIDHLDGLSDVQLQFEHPTETAKPPFEADTSPFQSTEVEMSPFQSTEADMSPFQSTEVEMSPFQSTEADMSPFHSALQCILHMAHETSQLQVVQECVTGPMTLTSRHSTATAPPLPLHYPLRQLCGVRVMEGARKGRKGREEGMVLVRELVRDWMGRDVRSTEDVTRSDLELVGILRKILLNASMAIEQVRGTVLLRRAQAESRQLRTRQRANYDKLMHSLSVYRGAVGLLSLDVATTIGALCHQSGSKQNRPTAIRHHKKVLKVLENLCSQTSPAKNRWEEARALCFSLAALLSKT